MNQAERLQWLRARQKGIGGSDVAAILGINPWKTRFQVWQEKVAQDPIEIPDNDPMRFGRKLEPIIADEYCEKSGRKVQRENQIRKHSKMPFLLANIDRKILADPHAVVDNPIKKETGVLEVKTVGFFAIKQWEAQVPIQYFCQLQHYLFVMGFHWGAFAILSGGNQYYSFDVYRNDEYLKHQNAELEEFWRKNVLEMVPPEMDHNDYETMLPLLGTVAKATPEVIGLCTDLFKAREVLKDAAKVEEEIVAEIKTFIGENESLMDRGTLLATWKKSVGRKSCDFDKLKKLDPKIYKKVVTQGAAGRRFDFKFSPAEE